MPNTARALHVSYSRRVRLRDRERDTKTDRCGHRDGGRDGRNRDRDSVENQIRFFGIRKGKLVCATIKADSAIGYVILILCPYEVNVLYAFSSRCFSTIHQPHLLSAVPCKSGDTQPHGFTS